MVGKRMRLSEPMIRVLTNLLNGRSASAGLCGRSEYGGHEKVIRALYQRKLITADMSNVTDAGLDALGPYLENRNG